MTQKRQKSPTKILKKGSDNKENKKTQKNLTNNIKLSQQELQNLQTQMMQQFFARQLKKTTRNINIASINEQMAQNIMNGQIKISNHSKSVKSLIKSPQEQALMKITPQQMEIYEKEAKRIQHLKLISNLNKQLVNKQPEQSISYILTKEQHQRKVRSIVEEKKLLQRRIEEAKQALKQKLQKQQKEAEQKAEQLKEQQKQRKRIQIQQKITKQKEQHIHFISSDITHRKDLEELIKKAPLHVKMENNFKNSIEMPALEQRKQQLKQLRDFRHRYSIDNIKLHEQEYVESCKQRLQQSNIRKLSSLSRIRQNESKLPKKSERLQAILVEEIQNKKRQLKEKQTYAEEKLKREQDYSKKLKEQHRPKIDKEKQSQILRRLMKQKQHLSKVGLDIDRRKVGLQYLGEVKKEAKIRKQQIQNLTAGSLTQRSEYKSESSFPQLKRSLTHRSVLSNYRNPQFFEKLRENKISRILNSNEQPERKMEKLKIQSQKLQEAKQRKLGMLKHNFSQIASKQASSLALNSLKAKINLIQLMKRK